MKNSNTISDNSNQVKWQCQHCFRWYSKPYKHKLHSTKCIVYQNKCNTEYDVMLQMKDEVKHECVKLFQQMLIDFKMDIVWLSCLSTDSILMTFDAAYTTNYNLQKTYKGKNHNRKTCIDGK